MRAHLLTGASSSPVCLICLEAMGRSQAVWACGDSCHCAFHLVCIQVDFVNSCFAMQRLVCVRSAVHS